MVVFTGQWPQSLSTRRVMRGTAIITALLILVLVTTIGAALLQKDQQLLRNMIHRQDRSALLSAMRLPESMAISALIQTRRVPAAQVAQTHDLTQPWAQPIIVEQNNRLLATTVLDQQGWFDLNNLYPKGENPQAHAFWRGVLKRLWQQAYTQEQDSTMFDQWIEHISQWMEAGSASVVDAPIGYQVAHQPFAHISELSLIADIPQEAMTALLPLVTALPRAYQSHKQAFSTAYQALNINTLSTPIIAALFDISLEQAEQLAQQRPFKQSRELKAAVSNLNIKNVSWTSLDEYLHFQSRYFLIQTRGQAQNVRASTDVLVELRADGQVVIIWRNLQP